MGIQQLMMGMQGAAAILPPVNTVAPSISGTNTVGGTLTVADGTWTGDPTITYARQWLLDGANISGATNITYVSVAGDVGKTITCRVTATNPGGSTPAVSNGIAIIEAASGIEYLIVAGGGSSAAVYFGGGGGAGGVLTGSISIASGVAIPVTVGAGGISSASGASGANSIFNTLTAIGGGKGASGTVALTGGSGGGGGTGNGAVTAPGAAGTVGQGFAGGNGDTGSLQFTSGGGGGGSLAGANGNFGALIGGKGGDGLLSSITGTSTRYGGGGGGCGDNGGGAGGAGGGGAGDFNNGISGTANTGGGGGAGYTTAGNGGSGVVILKYADTLTATLTGVVGTTAPASGGFKVTTITSGSGSVTLNPNPAGTNFTMTAGSFGGVIGWNQGFNGSSAPPAPTIGIYTITGVWNNASVVTFQVAGSHVGANTFTSMTVNGNTYLKANANNPAGAVNSTNTIWQWTGSAGIVNGGVYPCVVT